MVAYLLGGLGVFCIRRLQQQQQQQQAIISHPQQHKCFILRYV